MYCTKEQVYSRFGSANVSTWANLENDTSVDVDAQVDDAIALACADIDDRFRGGPYVLPLSMGAGSARVIADIAATLAAWRLYTQRGLADTEESGKLKGIRDEALGRLHAYVSGAARLDAVRQSWSHVVPTVV
jgi:phage gp36-like protein